MVLRRLAQEEHGRTRALWEKVFCEDTKAFLDYYYFFKASKNQIFVIEEEGEILSMLHLNPYSVKLEERTFESAYVVAVATKEECRRRGYMGKLLRAALTDLYERKLPFVFLMPAAEAIYTPYDFRSVYWQKRFQSGLNEWFEERLLEGEESGVQGLEEPVTERDAGIWDAERISSFFSSHFRSRYQVCTERDEEYYRTAVMEQLSENGGIRLLERQGRLVAVYCYARESGLEIREPLVLPGFEAHYRRSVEKLARYFGLDQVTELAGETGERRPTIMVRIVCFPKLLSSMKTNVSSSLDFSFAVIDPILQRNSRIWRVTSPAGEERLYVRETEDSEGVIPISELTEFLFGVISAEELREREGVFLSGHLMEQLQALCPLNRIYINEVV